MYSSKSRGLQAKMVAAAASSSVSLNDKGTARSSASWAMLIKRVYELDPLACPQCGGEMTVVAFVEPPQADVIEKILKHCGLWQASARPPPARAKGERERMACRSPEELHELTYVDQDMFEASF